jgi:hypothetical protein
MLQSPAIEEIALIQQHGNANISQAVVPLAFLDWI